MAAIIHDASRGEDSNLVQTVGAAAARTLRNERLDAELKVRGAEREAITKSLLKQYIFKSTE